MKSIHTIEWIESALVDGCISTHMINELREIPDICNTQIAQHFEKLQEISSKIWDKKVVICGMGSSYFLANFGAYFFKHIAGCACVLAVEADRIMEEVPDLGDRHVVIGLSQSGNSQETISALQIANKAWAYTYSLHNQKNSSCENVAQMPILQNIGTEKSPVSTKYIAFQLVLLYTLAVFIGENMWRMPLKSKQELLHEIQSFAAWVSYIFQEIEETIKNIAIFNKNNDFLVVWGWIDTHSAQEIALKIRETTWLHAIYDTPGNLKHGGINSIHTWMCCLAFNISPELQQALEWKGATVISLGNSWKCDISLPSVNRYLNAWFVIIAGQLFVHYLSCALNINTDIKNW